MKQPPKYLHPLIIAFEASSNNDVAIQMEKYMRNKFKFFGIKSPQRKELYRDFKKANGLIPENDKESIVKWCWEAPEREYQMFAMEFLRKSVRTEKRQIIILYEYMIKNKSWWDTVDFIAANLVGVYFKKYPELIEVTTNSWMNTNNIWLQRTCLLFQLKYRNMLDTRLLDGFVSKLNNSNEFFIQKAIGWILREYSKTDAQYVIDYVTNNKLAPLSKREALLWLKNKGKI